MIQHMLITGAIYALIRMTILYRAYQAQKSKATILRLRQTIYVKKEIVLGVMWVYLFGLFSQTLRPNFFYLTSMIDEENLIKTIMIQIPYMHTTFNFVPFRQIIKFLSMEEAYSSLKVLNLVGNIVMFVPFGFLLPVYDNKRFSSIKKIVLCGFFLSVLIETLQIFIGRTVDVDDVILNTLGVAIGAVLYRWLPNKITTLLSVKHPNKMK